MLSGFFKKGIEERKDLLRQFLKKDMGNVEDCFLDEEIADMMIENCIGVIRLPLGVGLNFVINGCEYIVPMVTEESSVIAAASNAAKIVSQKGSGFVAEYSGDVMISQIQFVDILKLDVEDIVRKHKDELIDFGNSFCTNNHIERGGGIVDIWTKVIEYDVADYFLQTTSEIKRMLIVYVSVDVGQAMGANMVNTISEGLAPYISQLIDDGQNRLRIVSNYSTERRATSTFRIPVNELGTKDIDGEDIANRIIESYIFACKDVYRAVTHNKGIMNGIDAVSLALGQDTRAIESGCHSWASRNGTYQPLTQYKLEKENNITYLVGFIDIPIQIGVVGGSVKAHPKMRYTHEILDNPTTEVLGWIFASVGLASNFAALRALVSEGIQRGHMSLHAKNIALQAGVPFEYVNDVALLMVSENSISTTDALELFESLQQKAKL